jgi:4-hydroxy-4-methyl-2-oxoglutarate aldolase
MTDKQLLEKVRNRRLADLGDGLDALGLVDQGSMHYDMRPIRPGITFAGFAYTVQLLPAQKTVKVAGSVKEYMGELDRWCSDTYAFAAGLKNGKAKDRVCVIDMGGYPGGIWGSEIGAAMMKEGLEGVVINGGCRDSNECNIEGVKAFCMRRTFNHVYGRLINGGVEIPIKCAGVTVRPGDVVCADDDGVLVIPRDRLLEVLEYADFIHEDDQQKRAKHYQDLGIKPDESLGRFKPR